MKPYFQIAWNDPAKEENGYKYLYLTEEDLAKLPEGVVSGEFITEGGEKRYKLDYIVGEKDGIGVENLRGSGLIAGETSQADAQTEPEPSPYRRGPKRRPDPIPNPNPNPYPNPKP